MLSRTFATPQVLFRSLQLQTQATRLHQRLQGLRQTQMPDTISPYSLEAALPLRLLHWFNVSRCQGAL